MSKKIQQFIVKLKKKILLSKKTKNWKFDNVEEFLEYCGENNIKTLENKYVQLSKLKDDEVRLLERKVKDSSDKNRIINIKHLNIMTTVVQKASTNGLEYTNSVVLYTEITKYLKAICEEKYESYDYIDLFYEMYTLNLETPEKIKNLVNKYLISMGKLAS